MAVAIEFGTQANGRPARSLLLAGVAMAAMMVWAHDADSTPSSLPDSFVVAPAVVAETGTTLTSTELAAFKISLTAALQAAKGNDDAVNAAISNALQNAVAKYGRDAAGPITSAIIAVAEQAGISSALIGSGLALGAVEELKNNQTVSTAIAQILANEGKPDEIKSFQFTVAELESAHPDAYDKKWADDNGTPPPDLVAIAGSNPTPTGSIQGGTSGIGLLGSAFTGGFPGGGPAGNTCLTPSCTNL